MYKCNKCGKFYHAMWGNACHECSSDYKKHCEILKALTIPVNPTNSERELALEGLVKEILESETYAITDWGKRAVKILKENNIC